LAFRPCKFFLKKVLEKLCLLKKSWGPLKALGGSLALKWQFLIVQLWPRVSDMAFQLIKN